MVMTRDPRVATVVHRNPDAAVLARDTKSTRLSETARGSMTDGRRGRATRLGAPADDRRGPRVVLNASEGLMTSQTIPILGSSWERRHGSTSSRRHEIWQSAGSPRVDAAVRRRCGRRTVYGWPFCADPVLASFSLNGTACFSTPRRAGSAVLRPNRSEPLSTASVGNTPWRDHVARPIVCAGGRSGS